MNEDKKKTEYEAGRINFEQVLQSAIHKANQMYISGNARFPLAVQNIWDNCLEADKDAIMKMVKERREQRPDRNGSYAEMRKANKSVREKLRDPRTFLQFMSADINSFTGHRLRHTGYYRSALQVINEGLKKRYYGKKRHWEERHEEA